jgi:glycosyltransferase involved in cell wall biosynthesis
VSVVVPTASRPGGSAASFTAADLQAAAQRHGLVSPQVVALERWVPYAERHRILNRSTLVTVLHRSSDEAALSFRTRALDGVWAGVPLLLSEGGEVARLAREHGWGAVIPPGDVAAVAAAMELSLGERSQVRSRAALAAGRDRWRWSRVVEPLVHTLPTLPAVRRGWLAGAALRAALRLLLRSGKEG